MKYVDKNGNVKGGNGLQDRFLSFLYGTKAGRLFVRPWICPAVSKAAGRFLDQKCSKILIRPFVFMNHIDLSGCEKKKFESYNDFFTRKLYASERPIAWAPEALISPCDGKLSVYPIETGGRFCIKHTEYTLEQLLRNRELAKKYQGGTILVFRLSVDDFHRYCYVDSGTKSRNVRIPGVFHTVNPVANDVVPIYKENTREYSLLRSEHFGTVLMMEVGALLVGKIRNLHEDCRVCKGQEKGYFAFGGSTVILLLQKNRVLVDREYWENTENGYETAVRMGEKIGVCR